MKKKLWGGRFTQPTSKTVERFTHSFRVDQRLSRYDLLGSLAHARMLGKTGIIPAHEASRLCTALEKLLRLDSEGKLRLPRDAEDVHTAIQRVLEQKAGAVAGRLHTARSRNDQVVTSLRLFCKEAIEQLDRQIHSLQQAILTLAEKSQPLIMPGMTHLRHAQPVAVGHLLLSYLSLLKRDRQRLENTRGRLDEMPLGSGALTGTGLPIDRQRVAKELGFARLMDNSVDAVTSRDFVMELLSNLAILSISLSRMAEDLILWSTKEFGFITFHERLLTGSSMMPQKQNPDFLELVRAGSSKVVGNLLGILHLTKALPSGYQRDLQNDKAFLFEALDHTRAMLEVLTEGFRGIRFNPKALEDALEDDALYATDLAEYLVKRGVAFTPAHQTVGKVLRRAEQEGVTLRALSLKTFRSFHPAFEAGVFKLFDAACSIQAKRSAGSTHPNRVAAQIAQWKKSLGLSAKNKADSPKIYGELRPFGARNDRVR